MSTEELTNEKITNWTCLIAVATFVVSCVTPPSPQAKPPQNTVPFDESALQPFAAKGTSTLTGQAFLKTVGGEVRYGAGENVSLIPVTPYTTQRTKALLAANDPKKQSAANRRPAGQSDGSDNLAAIVAADRAFPAAVAKLVRRQEAIA